MRALRSTPRRKRDTTTRTVDILNGVNSSGAKNNNKKNNSPRARGSQSTGRRGRRSRVQAPRSDDIWAIPAEEEDESLFTMHLRRSEPLTPRPSSRIKGHPSSQKTPGRKFSETPREQNEEQDEEQNGEQEEESSDGDGSEVRLFSDEYNPDSARSKQSAGSKSSNLPSPSVLFQKDRFAGLDFGEESEVDEVPDTQLAQDEAPSGRGLDQIAGTDDPNESSSVQATPRRSKRLHVVEPVPSSDTREETRHRSSRLPSRNDADNELFVPETTEEPRNDNSRSNSNLDQQPAHDQEHEESEDQEWDNEEESSGSSGSSDNESNLSVAESFRFSPGGVDESTRPRPTKRRRRSSSLNQVVEVQVFRRAEREYSLVTESIADALDDVGDDIQENSILAEAIKNSSQRGNWTTMIQTASHMDYGAALPSLRNYYKDMEGLMDEARKAVEGITNKPPDSRRSYSRGLRECDNLLRATSSEGTNILDRVCRWCTRRDDPVQRRAARELLSGFEALVVPKMVTLVTICFEEYYMDRTADSVVECLLHWVMTLLLQFCSRVSSLGHRDFVNWRSLSLNLCQPLKELIKALESKTLKSSMTGSSTKSSSEVDDTDDEKGSPISDDNVTREWTDRELSILIEGLQRYQGSSRYVDIMKAAGHRLPGRTVQELRAKAREIRDCFLPQIEDEVQTADGRREFQWVLSV